MALTDWRIDKKFNPENKANTTAIILRYVHRDKPSYFIDIVNPFINNNQSTKRWELEIHYYPRSMKDDIIQIFKTFKSKNATINAAKQYMRTH